MRANGSIDTETVRQHARRERARVVGTCIDNTLLLLTRGFAHCWCNLRQRIAAHMRVPDNSSANGRKITKALHSGGAKRPQGG